MFAAAALGSAFALSVPAPDISVADAMFARIQPTVDQRGVYVMVTLNLWVEPDGGIAECTLGKVVGDKDLAPLFCEQIKEFRLDSPRDETGRKTFALVNYSTSAFGDTRNSEIPGSIKALLAQKNSGDPDAQLEIRTSSIGAEDFFWVNVDIDSNGSVTACDKYKDAPDDLVESACAIAKQKAFVIRRSRAGEPVSYVRKLALVSKR